MNFRDDAIIDVINIIKEDRSDREQSSAILERHRYRNYEFSSMILDSIKY